MNVTTNPNKIDKNFIVLFVLLFFFFVADSMMVNTEKELRVEFELELTSEFESVATQESDTAHSESERIDELSTIKTIVSFISVVIFVILLILWFRVSIQHKFISIALMLVYAAGMHMIDYEYLVLLSKFDANVQVAKYVVVRLFPPVLFIILFLASIIYKPIPKSKQI